MGWGGIEAGEKGHQGDDNSPVFFWAKKSFLYYGMCHGRDSNLRPCFFKAVSTSQIGIEKSANLLHRRIPPQASASDRESEGDRLHCAAERGKGDSPPCVCVLTHTSCHLSRPMHHWAPPLARCQGEEGRGRAARATNIRSRPASVITIGRRERPLCMRSPFASPCVLGRDTDKSPGM